MGRSRFPPTINFITSTSTGCKKWRNQSSLSCSACFGILQFSNVEKNRLLLPLLFWIKMWIWLSHFCPIHSFIRLFVRFCKTPKTDYVKLIQTAVFWFAYWPLCKEPSLSRRHCLSALIEAQRRRSGVVSVLAFYFGGPSSNPAEVYNFYCAKMLDKERK